MTEPRYPRVDPSVIGAGADVVLLPDEPYPFSDTDGPDAFGSLPCVTIAGHDLSWYGPAMIGARQRLEAALAIS